MPVLPSVTWSVAVRTVAGASAAARASANAQGESKAVPASAVEVWMNWRRLTPRPILVTLFFCMEK